MGICTGIDQALLARAATHHFGAILGLLAALFDPPTRKPVHSRLFASCQPSGGAVLDCFMKAMFAAVGLQIAVTCLAGLIALASTGSTSAFHLVLGGLAAIIPNTLFAARLALHRNRAPESYPVVFFLGEFFKIGFTIALMALVVKWQPQLQWLPFLIGLMLSLKAPLFAFLVVDKPVEPSSPA
jgi:ATP synthase protein I